MNGAGLPPSIIHPMNLMKPTLVLGALLAFALPAASQQSTEGPPRPRIVPPPVAAQQAAPAHKSDLPHNVELALDGSLLGAADTGFSVTTCGRTVNTDMPLESEGLAPIVGTFQANLTPGEPWQVQVSIGVRVPLKSGDNIEYRDLTLSTTVRIAPGKKVVLWQKGEQKLTLSMEKAEE